MILGPILLVALGAALLYLGGEALVAGASHLARALGMSPMVIGLTVVAFATSSPELFATLVAALEGAPAISLGNVLGSNIANLGLILGVSALIRALHGGHPFISREIPMLIGAAVAAWLVVLDGEIARWEGVLMIGTLVAYLYFVFSSGKPIEPLEGAEAELAGPPWPTWKSVGGVLLGLLLLTAGAHWLVGGAVDLARLAGVSERVIGLTLVAFGTSLPELASSVAAARRRQGDIVLGNVVGSNIFNVFCVLGITATVRPIPGGGPGVGLDLAVGLLLSLAMIPMLLVGRRLYLQRAEGVLLLLAYLAYITFLLVVEGGGLAVAGF